MTHETTNFLRLFSSSTTLLYLLPSTLVLIYVYYRLTRRRMHYLLSKIDGPPGYPLLGNALEFVGDPHTTYRIIWERSFEYKAGAPIKLWFGPKAIVFLTDPRDIEIILGSHVHLDKSPDYRFFHSWIGDGLLISSGEKWRAHRKLIAPTFHLNVLNSFMPSFDKNSRIIADKMRKYGSKEFDIHECMRDVTVGILLETAMGLERNVQEDRMVTEYVDSVMKMCDIVHLRQTQVWYRPEIIFQLTEYARTQEHSLGIIHGLTNAVIQYKKTVYKSRKNFIDDEIELETSSVTDNATNNSEKSPVGLSYGQSVGLKDDLDEDTGEKKRRAFLDLLLEQAENGVLMTDEEVREQVDTILFEGHDTTAAASSFFLCLMGCHPDIQENVIRELDTIFKGSDRSCTFEDTLEMKYLERCLLETLRMYSPVPMIARQIKEEVQLASTGAILPANCTVVIGTFKLHRDPTIYPNPDEFNPDRFLPEESASRHYYSYIPFSAGPRNCVGRKYAILKLKVLLSTILRQYRVISPKMETEWQLQADIILKRTDGFRVILESRTPEKAVN